MPYTWSDDHKPQVSKRGFDYASARRAYKSQAADDSLCSASETIETDASNVLIIRIDVTGSNKSNAKIFFDKLPLLYSEAQRYLPEIQISFGAVGDANSDKSPIQVCKFDTGANLDAHIESLFLEGGGGGQDMETYELTAYYDLHQCNIPNAINPFYFLLCDEGFYPTLNPDHVKEFVGLELSEPIESTQIFKQLMMKYNVFILRCPYPQNEQNVQKQWIDVFGDDRVILLEDPRRVVDCIIGLIGKETGNFDDFSKRLSARQTSQQVDSVMGSIAKPSNMPIDGKSIMNKTGKSLRSRKLI